MVICLDRPIYQIEEGKKEETLFWSIVIMITVEVARLTFFFLVSLANTVQFTD